MSQPSSSAPKATGPAKPGVSPARNIIGLILLAVVVVVGGIQVMAVLGYNSAVNKLNARAGVEEKDLMTEKEAEDLMGGKSPDDAGSEVHDGSMTYLKKTYTWRGPIKSYPLYAYYLTSQVGTVLHHYETEEKKYVAEQAPAPTVSEAAPSKGQGKMSRPTGAGKGAARKKDSDKKDEEKKGMQPPAGPPDDYRKAMGKAPAAKPDDKKAEDKAPAPKADDKAPAAKPDDKAPAPKADDKAPAAKPDDKKADDKAK
jgi:hypothetical protein